MKYTPATYAKALTAFVLGFSGALGTGALTGVTTATLLAAVGAGLIAAAGVFATPNKSTDVALSPADQVINNLPVVVQNVSEAAAELERVKQAATDVLGDVPILGPLANAIINGRR